MSRIIITDLTRFNTEDRVCTAGTHIQSGRCIRPMPYLTGALCKKLGILPGSVLTGDFVPAKGLSGPHQEDANYTPQKLSCDGPSSSLEFKKALKSGLYDSVEEGFEIELAD